MLIIFYHTLQQLQFHEIESNRILAIVFAIILLAICVFYVSGILETIYAKIFKKPYFVHFYFPRKKIAAHLKYYLGQNAFYSNLSSNKKKYFEHRIARFLEKTDFIGRQDLKVTDEMRMLVAMTCVQLTFGMRNYLLNYLDTIVFYPSSYFSILNQTENKGEFSPVSRSLVLSWKHFKEELHNKSKSTNLGVHEITHAIHYNAIKNNDISSEIFYDTILELEKYLEKTEVRAKLVNTNILRSYAFTDKFEFIAVLVEVFMQSPKKLKATLPVFYKYVQQMLNFRYFE